MSIYIHIPFCNSICSYCDFCKVYYDKKYIYDYLENLKKEISSRYKGEKVNTIFIGGGTPSSLDIDELRYLFDIIGVFDKDIYCEFTMECNIDSISEEKLIIMKKYVTITLYFFKYSGLTCAAERLTGDHLKRKEAIPNVCCHHGLRRCRLRRCRAAR